MFLGTHVRVRGDSDYSGDPPLAKKSVKCRSPKRTLNTHFVDKRTRQVGIDSKTENPWSRPTSEKVGECFVVE